jgi:spermidine synthase
VDGPPEVLERCRGRSGELVLRRRGGEYEVVCNGTFLIAGQNEVSSRALIVAAGPHLPRRPLDVLIGGLGMGFALDEALALPDVRAVTVVEYEPVVVEWYERYFRARASRGSRDARARIVADDVHDVLAASSRAYDLIALDTDNGPAWLVRDENARLYEDRGLRQAAGALRTGGVVVFWAPDRETGFERRLAAVFEVVLPVTAADVVDGRTFDYVMYVCRGGELR